MKPAARELAIGDRLIHEGDAYVVCGFTPMGVDPARIYLTKASRRQPHGDDDVVSLPVEELVAGEPERDVA